jgi:hypothetical protein
MKTDKLIKNLFGPIIEIHDLIKEASGKKTNFLSMQDRQEIVEDPFIERIEVCGLNSVSIKSKLKYSTMIPIHIKLFHFGNKNSREEYVEITESNIGETAFQILEKRNQNYPHSSIKEILDMYNCREIPVVGTRIPGPSSIGDLISGINNVAYCCRDISNFTC